MPLKRGAGEAGAILGRRAVRCLSVLASFAVLWALVGAISCSREPQRASAPIPPCSALRRAGPAQPRSVVFIVADALRRDRLGVYGGPARTPGFDRFARENLLFTAAFTQAPWTKPSIATLFTGLYPSQHRVATHPQLPDPESRRRGEAVLESDVLSEDLVTLAEVMRAAGFRTAAFVSNPWLGKSFGFAQGFETYDDSFAGNDTPGRVVSQAGLDWLAALPDRNPYLLYLHYMDPHAPYAPIPVAELERRRETIEADARPLSRRARRAIANRALTSDGRPAVARGVPANLALMELVYDQGVERFDTALAAFLEGFAEVPGSEDSVLLITSDHGEALFARGWGSHGYGFFDDETAIPLAAQLPGVSGRSPIDCPVGLIDLRATLCDHLAMDCAGPDFGVSLLPPLEEPERRPSRYLVSEGILHKPSHRSIRNRTYKLIWEPEGAPGVRDGGAGYSLFSVAEDPDELHDLLAGEDRDPGVQAVFEAMSAALPRSVADFQVTGARRVPVDEETQRRLEELGYVESDGAE